MFSGQGENLMNSLAKKSNNDTIISAIAHRFDEIDINTLSHEQIEKLSKLLLVDKMKEELSNEIRKVKIDGDMISELKETWLQQYDSINTRRMYEKNLLDFLTWLNQKNLNIIEVNAFIAQKYLLKMKEKKYSNINTVLLKINSISSFYTSLVKWDIVEKNPFHKCKLPKKLIETKRRSQIPTDKQLDKIERFALDAINATGRGCQNKRIAGIYSYIIIRFLRLTGERVGILNTLVIDLLNNEYHGESKGKKVSGMLPNEIASMIIKYDLDKINPFKGFNSVNFSKWWYRLMKSPDYINELERPFSIHSLRHAYSINYYKSTNDIFGLALPRKRGHEVKRIIRYYA